MTTKLSLRRLITSRLKALPPSEIQRQSSEIFHMLVSHDKFKEARLISLYLSTDLEIDTIRLLRYALEEANKRCFVPFIDPNGDRTRMSMVELKSMRHYDRLSTNGFGIKEMTSLVDDDNGLLSEASELDLMIVPGVAFSLDGRRLGHGKGYYDRYLWEWERKQLPSNKRLYTIGLAIREQLVDDPLAVPGQDYTLDEVLVAPRRD